MARDSKNQAYQVIDADQIIWSLGAHDVELVYPWPRHPESQFHDTFDGRYPNVGIYLTQNPPNHDQLGPAEMDSVTVAEYIQQRLQLGLKREKVLRLLSLSGARSMGWNKIRIGPKVRVYPVLHRTDM
jgi:hypothetical protein